MFECCVCLEMYDRKIIFNCDTCLDGKICEECMIKIDKNLACFEDDKDEVKKSIKCPCCRTLNWKYCYNTFVWYYVNDVVYNGACYRGTNKPVCDLMRKYFHSSEEEE